MTFLFFKKNVCYLSRFWALAQSVFFGFTQNKNVYLPRGCVILYASNEITSNERNLKKLKNMKLEREKQLKNMRTLVMRLYKVREMTVAEIASQIEETEEYVRALIRGLTPKI